MCVCDSTGIDSVVQSETISVSSSVGVARILVWVALGAAGWSVLLTGVMITIHLVG